MQFTSRAYGLVCFCRPWYSLLGGLMGLFVCFCRPLWIVLGELMSLFMCDVDLGTVY